MERGDVSRGFQEGVFLRGIKNDPPEVDFPGGEILFKVHVGTGELNSRSAGAPTSRSLGHRAVAEISAGYDLQSLDLGTNIGSCGAG